MHISPNEGIDVFRHKLEDLEETIIGTDSEIIVAGDFNAKFQE